MKIFYFYRLILCYLFLNLTAPPVIAMPSSLQIFSYEDAQRKLSRLGEGHLLEKWPQLNESAQKNLLEDIHQLDDSLFLKQQAALKKFLNATPSNTSRRLDPFENFFKSGSTSMQSLGKQLISQGKVACLIVAGGQGTRLSYEAPKGTFPVTNIKKKSLFQIFAEKTIAAGKQANCLLPLAIMTSPQTHQATIDFFKSHDHFGLADSQLYFFIQNELPFLDADGHLMLNSNRLVKGPDGNGNSLSLLVNSGIWQVWHQQGIEYVNYILVDNPLADPFDAELVGFHAENACDITVKCIERSLPEEKVGLLVLSDEKVTIIEYSEMDDAERKAVRKDGRLKHHCTNLSLFCFSMDFIKRTSQTSLPWHFAFKPTGAEGACAWKFETFIFDHLAAAKDIKALLYPRKHCFAPLKNSAGQDSLQTVQEALLKNDCAILENLTGKTLSNEILIELDPQFYYPTASLMADWKGREGPFEGYITPDYKKY